MEVDYLKLGERLKKERKRKSDDARGSCGKSIGFRETYRKYREG